MSNVINDLQSAGVIHPIDSPIEGVEVYAMRPADPNQTFIELQEQLTKLQKQLDNEVLATAHLRRVITELKPYQDLTESLGKALIQNPDFMEDILKYVRDNDCIEYDKLAQEIDLDDLANAFSYSELAYELDYDRLAQEFSISDIVDELDTNDIAQQIDLSDLAEHFSIDVRVNR